MGILSKRVSSVCLGIFCATAWIALSQSLPSASGTANVPAKPVIPQPYPVIDPASALTGEALLQALRQGGFVLYMRHTETGSAITEQCNVTNLSPKGDAAARELGRQLKQFRVPVGRVKSSPICRVLETAKLLEMGEVELSDDLGNVSKVPGVALYDMRMRQLVASPREGTNTLAVSHMHGGGEPHQAMDLEFGEIIVFRPDGKGGSTVVARIRAEGWRAFAPAVPVSK